MSFSLAAMALSLGVGVLAWVALVPLVSLVPFNMQKGWQQECINFSRESAVDVDPKLHTLSLQYKLGFCVIAVGVSILVLYFRGATVSTGALIAYLLGTLLIAAINLRTSLLPDKVVLTLLWAGLLYNASLGNGVDPIYGAATAFGIPWLINILFKANTGKEVIGYGDMKTFAMAGAWFGLASLPTLLATFFVGLALMYLCIRIFGFRLSDQLPTGEYIPSGAGHLASSVAWVVGVRFFA